MSVRILIENDYAFGGSRNNIISGYDECLQKCQTLLMQVAGEWFLDYRDGIDWGTAFTNAGTADTVIDLTKSSLLKINGVISIRDISAIVENRKVYLIANIETKFGTINLNREFNALELISDDKISR